MSQIYQVHHLKTRKLRLQQRNEQPGRVEGRPSEMLLMKVGVIEQAGLKNSPDWVYSEHQQFLETLTLAPIGATSSGTLISEFYPPKPAFFFFF